MFTEHRNTLLCMSKRSIGSAEEPARNNELCTIASSSQERSLRGKSAFSVTIQRPVTMERRKTLLQLRKKNFHFITVPLFLNLFLSNNAHNKNGRKIRNSTILFESRGLTSKWLNRITYLPCFLLLLHFCIDMRTSLFFARVRRFCECTKFRWSLQATTKIFADVGWPVNFIHWKLIVVSLTKREKHG